MSKGTDGKKTTILVLSDGRAYGPFPNQDIAQGWIDSANIRQSEMYSMFEPAELGTADKAHECGTRLTGIDEATTTTRRGAAAG